MQCIFYDTYINLWELNQDLQSVVFAFVSKYKTAKPVIEIDIEDLSISVFTDNIEEQD